MTSKTLWGKPSCLQLLLHGEAPSLRPILGKMHWSFCQTNMETVCYIFLKKVKFLEQYLRNRSNGLRQGWWIGNDSSTRLLAPLHKWLQVHLEKLSMGRDDRQMREVWGWGPQVVTNG